MLDHDVIARLMDALLPGGAGFPAASTTGSAAMVTDRLRIADPALPANLIAAVGSPPDTPAAWIDAAARLETHEPRLFSEFLKYAYLTYYEQPAVIAAIRALGHPYNDSPLPGGYPDDPFVSGRDAPSRPVGHWLDTHEIQPVDLSALRLE